MEKIVIAVICFVILGATFPLVLFSSHAIQVEEQTDPLLAISTNKVTLTKDLWQDDPNSVLGIVGYDTNGDPTGESIYAVSYAPAPSRQLTLVGVTTSTKATVTYEVEGLKEWVGLGMMVGISPLLIWVGAAFGIIIGLFFMFKSKFGS